MMNLRLNFMKKFKADFTYTAYQIIDKKGKIIGERSAKDNISFIELLSSCDIGLSTVMLKKKLFDNQNFYFPNIKTKEDYVVWLKLSQNGIKMYGIKKNYSYWRKLDNSLSSSSIQKIFDGFKVYYVYMNYGIFRSILNLISLFPKIIFSSVASSASNSSTICPIRDTKILSDSVNISGR